MTIPGPSRLIPRGRACVGTVLLLGLLAMLCACDTPPDRSSDADIPLPELGGPGVDARPPGVYAMVRRVDVPLNESTDDAWAVIDEQAVPALTRGAWRGNGIRLGVLDADQRDAYAAAMPQPVYFGETLINQSPYPVPIFAGPRLRSDLRLDVDLTIPPMPPNIERLAGGRNSNLQLLARIETEVDGSHTIVLTPHHHVPQPLGLVARDPLERELDGRVFDELTVRITLAPDKIAVVALYWPWPVVEQLPPAPDPAGPEPDDGDGPDPALVLSSTTQANDPAAPPPHIQQPPGGPDNNGGTARDEPTPRAPDAGPADTVDPPAEPTPRLARVAPVLPVNFGSTLFTGTRIRQPVKTVLLITIELPPASSPQSDDQNGKDQ